MGGGFSAIPRSSQPVHVHSARRHCYLLGVQKFSCYSVPCLAAEAGAVLLAHTAARCCIPRHHTHTLLAVPITSTGQP